MEDLLWPLPGAPKPEMSALLTLQAALEAQLKGGGTVEDELLQAKIANMNTERLLVKVDARNKTLEEEVKNLMSEAEELKCRLNQSLGYFDPQGFPFCTELDGLWDRGCLIAPSLSDLPLVVPVLRYLVLFTGVPRAMGVMKGLLLLWMVGLRDVAPNCSPVAPS
ncbi:uncharacterized protein LOC144671337 [Cetorhinus maximus]